MCSRFAPTSILKQQPHYIIVNPALINCISLVCVVYLHNEANDNKTPLLQQIGSLYKTRFHSVNTHKHRERERDRERQRKRQRERNTERDRESETDRHSHTDTH